jgi:hypothetical protein
MSSAKTDGVPFWLGALLIAVVLAVAPVPDWMIERFYSRDFYPLVQGIVTSMSNVVPLALLDVFILIAVAIVIRWIVLFVGALRTDGIIDAVWEIFRRVVRGVSIVAILFLLMWGLNYRRTPLEEALRQPAMTLSADDLQGAIAEANAVAARVRPALATSAEAGYEDVVRRLPKPFNDALHRIGRPPLDVTGRPKYSLFLTPYFTAAGIDGMINPLALESVVHPDLLPFERPFVLAHEWAHLSGAGDEAEASAIGWLACMQGDPALAYSASLYLIGEAGSALPVDRWRTSASRLDPGVRQDLDAIARREQREQPAVRDAASRVYDTYLRANRVDDGVASYNRAVTLILSSPFRDAFAQFRIEHQP